MLILKLNGFITCHLKCLPFPLPLSVPFFYFKTIYNIYIVTGTLGSQINVSGRLVLKLNENYIIYFQNIGTSLCCGLNEDSFLQILFVKNIFIDTDNNLQRQQWFI